MLASFGPPIARMGVQVLGLDVDGPINGYKKLHQAHFE